MKTRIHLLMGVLFLQFTSISYLNAQTENFEGFSAGATSFTTSSGTFSLSGLEVARGVGFGSGTSDQFLDTGFGASSSGGTITASGSGMSFQISTLDGWTSNNQGGSDQAGVDVTFIGTLLEGGTISQTIEVNPTGFTGNDWDETLGFSSGTWSGQNLTALEVRIESSGNAADYIALDDMDFAAITFPVEFIRFSAIPSGADVVLTWETASELNNKGFEIQQTFDNEHFETVGFVDGNGTTSNISQYTFHHADGLTTNKIGYRLRQVDFDGKHQFSQLIEVSVGNDIPFSYSAFPNPCSAEQLAISYQTEEPGTLNYTILSIDGKAITSGSEEVLPGLNEFRLSVEELPAGMYILDLTQSGKNLQQKIMRL